SGGIDLRPTERDSLAGVTYDIGSPTNVKVYRGLAHPVAETSKYEKQVEKGGWFDNHDFKFYKEPLEVSDETINKVLDLYRDPKSHQAWGPKEKCAGFHPDYVLIWQGHDGPRAIQLCYGCHEWKFFGPGGEFLSDISEKAYFGPLTRRWLKKEKD
ncbi:MAG: hypothetical protein AAGB14_12560, partial [Verrucomicrobiota bacterium]